MVKQFNQEIILRELKATRSENKNLSSKVKYLEQQCELYHNRFHKIKEQGLDGFQIKDGYTYTNYAWLSSAYDEMKDRISLLESTKHKTTSPEIYSLCQDLIYMINKMEKLKL